MTMSPRRPYLLRALYEWILENDCTPYILVNAALPGVDVPSEHVKDGQIILNICPEAVRNLQVSNAAVSFDGRFGGVPRQVLVPVEAVAGIYAKENGQGMIFDSEPPTPGPPEGAPDTDQNDPNVSRKKPTLRVVK